MMYAGAKKIDLLIAVIGGFLGTGGGKGKK